MLLFRVVPEKSKDPLEKLMGDARQGRLKAGPYLAQFVNVIRGGYGDCAASSGDKRIAL